MTALAECIIEEQDVRAGRARVGRNLLPQHQESPSDCVRAALSSLLCVPARLLPTGLGETRHSWPEVRRWCRDLSGLDLACVTIARGVEPPWPVYADSEGAPTWCVVIQRRGDDMMHAVLADATTGEVVFDPWPLAEPGPFEQHPVAEVWALVDRLEAGS